VAVAVVDHTQATKLVLTVDLELLFLDILLL
jgi:hypothetical protein